ncbi:MAG: CPXCG motif-containing cysteine-rich protein [Aquisalimonadaceae bacterium]
MLDEITIECPYCGEPFTTLADFSAGSQQYIEDCAVCCRPIEFHVEVDAAGDPAGISVARDDD